MEERILRGKCGVRLTARQEEADGVLWREGEWELRRDEVQGFRGGCTEEKEGGNGGEMAQEKFIFLKIRH